MALSDAYATAAEYRADKGGATTSQDTQITAALKATARYIDRELGRWLGFNYDGTPVSRYYFGEGTTSLYIDDHVSVSAIAVDTGIDDTFATSLAASDYELRPRNAATGPEAEPYRTIEATRWGTLGVWPAGVRVRVTGVGGWPAVPPSIKSANIELCAILRIESPRATSSVTEMGQVLSTSKMARDIIRDLATTFRNHRGVIA